MVIAVLLPVLFLYTRTVTYGFSCLDDQWLILHNEEFLRSATAFETSFTHPVLARYYRPLFMISLLMDYRLYNLQPAGYHLTNLLLHLACLYALFRLLRLNGASQKSSVFFTLLFGIHPVNLHAVAWVPGRNDLLLCLFALSAIIFIQKWAVTGRMSFLGLHFLSFTGALLTKENAALLPVVFFLILRMLERRTLYRVLIPILWLLFVGAWFIARNRVGDLPESVLQAEGSRVVEFFASLMMYLGKFIFPVQLSVVPTTGNSWLWPGMLALLSAIWLIARSGFKDHRRYLPFLLLFTLTLAVPLWVSSVTGISEHYEHRAYLPLAALAVYFSGLELRIAKRTRQLAAALILCVCFTVSALRIGIYADNESFVEAGLKESPDFHIFYLQKGTWLMLDNNHAAAVPFFDKAVSLRPGTAHLYSMRGFCHLKTGNHHQSILDYDKAVELDPDHYEYRLNRLLAHWRGGNVRGAARDMYSLSLWSTEVKLTPEAVEVGNKLIDTIKVMRRNAQAEPGNARLNFEVAQVCLELGNTNDAAFFAHRATMATPENRQYRKFAEELAQLPGSP